MDPGHLKLNPSSQSTSAQPPSSAREPIRVAIAIGSKLERLGWSIVVGHQEDMDVAGQFSSIDAALAFIRDHPVDVALVEETLLPPAAWKGISRLSRRLPKLLILARHPAEAVLNEPRPGVVSRRLLKGLPASDLLAAIREAAAMDGAAAEAGRTSDPA